jgi:methyl-accepting chemotaxis protein
MGKRVDRKLHRRVRERMKKTGESYGAALQHLRTTSPKSLDPAPSVTKSEPTSRPRFNVHTAFALLLEQSPESQESRERAAAVREERAWARVRSELRRIGAGRDLEKACERFKAEGRGVEEIERLGRALVTLPTNYWAMLQAQVRQLRRVMAEAERIRRLVGDFDQVRTMFEMNRLDDFMSRWRSQLEALLPTAFEWKQAQSALAAATSQITEATAAVLRQSYTDAAALDSVGAAMRQWSRDEEALMDAVRTYKRESEGVVAVAIQSFEESAVGAALWYINDDPVMAAMRLVNDSPAAAAIRYMKGI